MAYSCGYHASPGRPARGGAAGQARPGVHQARPRAGHADARRRLRLGLAVAARRRALRRAGRRRDDRRGAEAVHRRPDRRARPAATGSRSGSGLPRGARARPLRRRRLLEMGEHVGQAQLPDVRQVLHRVGAAGRPGARPADVAPAGRLDRAAGRSSSRSSRPTCTCGRSARPSRCSRPAGSRCATSTRCASTTCSPWRAG